MKKTTKLSVSRETLRNLSARSHNGGRAEFSCVESCYLVTCGTDCEVSTGQKTE